MIAAAKAEMTRVFSETPEPLAGDIREFNFRVFVLASRGRGGMCWYVDEACDNIGIILGQY